MTKSRRWALHDAKARLSEVIRRAKNDGPQRITVHGRDEAVIVSVEDFRRADGKRTGAELVKVLQEAPLDETDVEPTRTRGPVRRVKL